MCCRTLRCVLLQAYTTMCTFEFVKGCDLIFRYPYLKQYRLNCKKTQADISDILGITQQQYYRYEKGIREIPVHHLIKLADFYNTSIDTLVSVQF